MSSNTSSSSKKITEKSIQEQLSAMPAFQQFALQTQLAKNLQEAQAQATQAQSVISGLKYITVSKEYNNKIASLEKEWMKIVKKVTIEHRNFTDDEEKELRKIILEIRNILRDIPGTTSTHVDEFDNVLNGWAMSEELQKLVQLVEGGSRKSKKTRKSKNKKSKSKKYRSHRHHSKSK